MTTSSSPRFTFQGTEGRWQFTIEGARALANQLGPDLFGGFLKCFLGLERLTSLLDLLIITQQALPENGLRRRRNTRLLVVLLQSALIEIAEALDELNKAKVAFAMTDRSLWAPLEAKRKQWLNDTRLRLVRNRMGHHLGPAKDFQEGLAALLRGDDTLVFAVGEGQRRIDEEQRLAWDALLRGLGHGEADRSARGMDLTDHEHVANLSQAALTELADELWPVWMSVLDHAGVSCRRVDSTLDA